VSVVGADTSPLNDLIQMKGDHVLPALHARVLVPSAVVDELAVLKSISRDCWSVLEDD
jgi:predicted nucleic acid-binding protein